MAKPPIRDPALHTLLSLDGEVLVIAEGRYWIKFNVKEVEVSPARPHGLQYSLTLHDDKGERLVGFDNAHALAAQKGPGRAKRAAHDHRHRLQAVRPYDYKDAGELLANFMDEVDAVLAERGVMK